MMNFRTIRAAAYLAAVFAILIWTCPARAADPIFPAGSRIGLVPPPGMALSKLFEGFQDPDKNAAILLATFPAEAYAQLDKTMVPDALKKQGLDVAKREPITLSVGNGFLLSGEQTSEKARYRKWLLIAAVGDLTALVTVQVPDEDTAYPEKAIRDSLATLAVRASVPDAEQLSLLPFAVGNLAGFRIDQVLPGRALMLVDASAGTSKDTAAANTTAPAKSDAATNPVIARMFVAAMPGGPAAAGDEDNLARVMFDQIGGIKEVRVQDAEPLRIGGQSGYQTLAQAKDVQSDTNVMVVQWLRFGTGGFLQMIAVARADQWPDMLTRLRTVRDSIDPK
jgi:hypothetical protein